MSTITWLHLSDLHACNPRHGWDARRVTDTLVDDLRRLQGDHELRPDLLFFTGDAAFGRIGGEGEKTVEGQLETFGAFLDAVRGAFDPEIALENVFMVPGNHDVDRTLVTDDQTDWLDAQTSLNPVLARIQAGDLHWKRIMERLGAYRSFLEERGFNHLLDPEADGTTHADPSRLIYSAVREVDGLRVGIAGFNTAWSCCRNGERGRLWMAGRWQQETLRPGLYEADLSIALMHHPPDWLGEFESPDFGRGLDADYRFLLHGHEHRAWVLRNDDYSVIAASACHEWSQGDRNGYNLVRLDTESGEGEVWLRRYDSVGRGWVSRPIARKTDDRGVWSLRLNWLRGLEPSEASGAEAVPPPPSDDAEPRSEPQPQSQSPSELTRYLQRLRAAHRDLPIAGFETKVRLPIQIQDVYIPLRAQLAYAGREDRAFGALRDLEGFACEDGDFKREMSFDESLDVAKQHGYRGVVVLGDPGSGKTTLLKHFVQAATDPLIGPASLGLADDTVPVLVELRRLEDPSVDVRGLIEHGVARADVALDPKAFASELLKRPLLVLVDGLDEVADEARRAQVSRRLEQALERLPESTFVITSRYAGYRDDARLTGRFLELHVSDVEREAAELFIGAWYLAVESRPELGLDAETAERRAQEAADDLIQKVFHPEDDRTSSLQKLAKNPLMLQILCLVHRDRKQLPERRVELYRECVAVLLELWRAAKGMPITFDAQQALRLLQPLAYALHGAEKKEAPLSDLLPHLEKPLRELRRDPEDGAKLLEAIRDQSGVLVSLGQNQFGFLHLSFQEYLTALHIQDRHGGGDSRVLRDLAEHFGDGWWREVILLCLGLNNPSLFGPLMDALIEAGVLHRDVALADDCLRDALASSPRPFLRALAAGIGDDSERYHVLRLLRAFEDWREVELDEVDPVAMIERLTHDDESPQVRGMAIELLGGQIDDGPTKAASSVEGFSIESTDTGEKVHEKDRSVLVYVPEGIYTLGTDKVLEGYLEKNRHWPQPEHRVELSGYWIGKYPVTNAQYGRFLEASGHREPEEWQNRQSTNRSSQWSAWIGTTPKLIADGPVWSCRARLSGKRQPGARTAGPIRGGMKRRARSWPTSTAIEARRHRWVPIREGPAHSALWIKRETSGSGAGTSSMTRPM